MAAAGFTDYRFGIAWSRIEPADGHISRADIGHYRRIVEGAVPRGDHDSLFKDTEQLIGAPNCRAQEPCAIHTDSALGAISQADGGRRPLTDCDS